MSAVLNPEDSFDNVYGGWRAELELDFASDCDKTVLVRRKHRGPLIVQRPFYPEDGACHVYLLHPPGGVVSGDRLAIDIHGRPGSAALITTPAAGKFYRSSGNKAHQCVSIKIAENASVEWLPQETIIYEGARLKSSIEINLAAGGRFVGWEMLSLGRPAANEGFAQGSAEMCWQLYRQGRPLYLERLQLDDQTLSANWGLNGYSACGALFASPATANSLQAVSLLIGDQPGRGVTLIDDLLICRAADTGTHGIRPFFERIWQILRADIVGREACAPRIWAT